MNGYVLNVKFGFLTPLRAAYVVDDASREVTILIGFGIVSCTGCGWILARRESSLEP